MPNGADSYSVSPNAIENDVGSSAHNQLANSRLRSGAAQVRLASKRLDDGDDSRGQSFRRQGFVHGDVGANFLEAG
jgi:hypothetical protein